MICFLLMLSDCDHTDTVVQMDILHLNLACKNINTFHNCFLIMQCLLKCLKTPRKNKLKQNSLAI